MRQRGGWAGARAGRPFLSVAVECRAWPRASAAAARCSPTWARASRARPAALPLPAGSCARTAGWRRGVDEGDAAGPRVRGRVARRPGRAAGRDELGDAGGTSSARLRSGRGAHSFRRIAFTASASSCDILSARFRNRSTFAFALSSLSSRIHPGRRSRRGSAGPAGSSRRPLHTVGSLYAVEEERRVKRPETEGFSAGTAVARSRGGCPRHSIPSRPGACGASRPVVADSRREAAVT